MQSKVVQPEGNYYDKYHSKNPIVRWMMAGFFGDIQSLLQKMEKQPERILEAGCGEGEVTQFLKKQYPSITIDAFDISEKIIKEINESEINFFVGDIYSMSIRKTEDSNYSKLTGGYNLVVCSEVLEHLEQPEIALKNCKEMSNGYLLLSVPNEPLWRILNLIRGKYFKTFGNTPGHIQHWSKNGFCKLLVQNGLKIIDVRYPLPWTVVLAKIE